QTCIQRRTNLDDLIRQEVANPTFAPNSLHYMLAQVARRKPLLIITTNYDDLLERAFDRPADGQPAIPYEVVATPADELAYVEDEEDGEIETGPEHGGAVWHRLSSEPAEDFKPVLGSELAFDLSNRSVIYKVHGSVPFLGGTWRGGYLIA